MNLLAIETASSVCGIALFRKGKCIDIQESQLNREHAEKLPLFYDRLSRKNRLDSRSIDGIAVSIGPGSFTGLRIGLSYAKGLAYSVDTLLVPVPTLQALVRGVKNKKGKLRCLLFSHKNFVYSQDFQFSDGYPMIKSSARSVVWENAILSLSEDSHIYHYGCDSLLNRSGIDRPITHVTPSAQYIGEIAVKEFTKLKQSEFHHIEPAYLSSFKNKRDSSKISGSC